MEINEMIKHEKFLNIIEKILRHIRNRCLSFYNSLKLGKVGKNFRSFGRLVLVNSRNVIVGDNVTIDRDVKIDLSSGGKLTLGDNVYIGVGVEIKDGKCINIGSGSSICNFSVIKCTKSGEIRLGKKVWVGQNSIIEGDSVIIADNAILAPFVHLIGGNHTFEKGIPINQQPSIFNQILINNDVWLGSGSKVLSDLKIGAGAVIGAGAIVTKDIPSDSIAVGIPAKVIKERGFNDENNSRQ